MKYNLFIFLHLLPVPLVLYPRNNCHIQSCELCVLSFLLRIYCLGLTFRPLIHSNFCKWCEVRVNSILLHMTIQISQHHVLKRQSFLPWTLPLNYLCWQCWWLQDGMNLSTVHKGDCRCVSRFELHFLHLPALKPQASPSSCTPSSSSVGVTGW